MKELDSLLQNLEYFLGDSKNGVSDNGQIQFNCPECDDNGNHYNLEVNVIRGKFRCWRCEHVNNMSGKLPNLIKRYGGEKMLSDYKDKINEIKSSRDYEFKFIKQDLKFEEDEELKITLPENSFDFKFDNNETEKIPLNYLTSRGLTKNMIKKYNLKYTNDSCPNKNLRNRIIITSYDKYGELNYYTGRDYGNRSYRKYYNVDNNDKFKKTNIIFNENLINWDGDVTLVEGPFDHLVVPNSIPLLGKTINSTYYLFDEIINKSNQNIIVFLDNDAYDDAIQVCKRLSRYELCGRLRIVNTNKLLKKLNNLRNLNLNKLDPGKLFELYGKKGIAWAICQSEEYQCI